MIRVERVRADEAEVLRSLRLAALLDSPSAFGSTHASEVDRPAEFWDERALRNSSGSEQATFFLRVDDDPCGLVGAYRPVHDAPAVELVSMWTAPRARRTGGGRALVEAVVAWARDVRADRMDLWVVRGNEPAQRLYQSVGFTETDDHQPLPSDPCKDEVRMTLRLS